MTDGMILHLINKLFKVKLQIRIFWHYVWDICTLWGIDLPLCSPPTSGGAWRNLGAQYLVVLAVDQGPGLGHLIPPYRNWVLGLFRPGTWTSCWKRSGFYCSLISSCTTTASKVTDWIGDMLMMSSFLSFKAVKGIRVQSLDLRSGVMIQLWEVRGAKIKNMSGGFRHWPTSSFRVGCFSLWRKTHLKTLIDHKSKFNKG